MRPVSKTIFLLLALFFLSPLAGKSIQCYLGKAFTHSQLVQTFDKSNNLSERLFLCGQEEVSDTDSDDTDDDKVFVNYSTFLSDNLYLQSSKNIAPQSRSVLLQNSEKLFILFHSLRLDC
jgi:hypothetical protein